MEDMEMWEVSVITSNLQFTDKQLWEATRIIGYLMSSPYMKEKKDLKEFLPMPWDKDRAEHKTTITDDEIQKMKIKSEYFSKILKGGK